MATLASPACSLSSSFSPPLSGILKSMDRCRSAWEPASGGLVELRNIRGLGWSHGALAEDRAPPWTPRIPPGPAEPRRKPERAQGVGSPSLSVSKSEVGLCVPFHRWGTEALRDQIICPGSHGRKWWSQDSKAGRFRLWHLLSLFQPQSWDPTPQATPMPDPHHPWVFILIQVNKDKLTK